MNADVISSSLLQLVTSPSLWALMLTAIPLGMAFGAVPGLGGRLGLVFSIPFVVGMDAIHGAVFLLAMHSVVHTGGSIPSILLGIPGSGPDAATVCDGFPMTLRGEAGRALGASLAASAVGGVVGAAFLAALLPVVQPVVLAFGPAEFFFLALLGIAFMAGVSGQHLAKGLLVGALGLLLSFVGSDPQTGIERFAFGQLFLYDGISPLVAVLGIFAIPETVALACADPGRPRVTGVARYTFHDLLDGVRDVGRHWGLTIRTSLIGSFIGLVPGLGGDVASWVCYGYAANRSSSPERFGKGAVEGVIGPEAANNSKEGGALLPTLFFGIPGSSGMTVMLGALIMLGLQPGPTMARDHMDVVWILIWTLVIANVLAAVMFLILGRWLALVTLLRPGLLVPFVLLLTLVGAFAGSTDWQSLPILVALGVLGYALKRGDWPRAPFVIGIALGPLVEESLHQSMDIWGLPFALRPLALVLQAAIVATLVASYVRWRRRPAAEPVPSDTSVSAFLLLLFAGTIALSMRYPPTARLLPLVVAIPGLALAAWNLFESPIRRRLTRAAPTAAAPPWDARERTAVAWVLGVVLVIVTLGFVAGGTLAVLLCHRFWLRESWRVSLAGAGATTVALVLCFERGLGLPLFGGLLAEWLR